MHAFPKATPRPQHGSVGETSAPPRVTGGPYRPEIQGLRAVAVLLVAVYHIWFGRVSGGVDVFLLLTGFLITGSLLRSVRRHGSVGFRAFWARLAKRLLPGAAVVLAGTLVATALFLPPDRWRATITEVLASTLYYQNWQLSLSSVDYLAQNNMASPAQHFWSLSIQGQFYLVCPVLVALGAGIAARRGWTPERVLLGVMAALFVASITYSILVTETNQQWAYFDTGARLWEFALGGILAIVLGRLRPPVSLRIALGWAGLLGLVLCGALLEVSTMFPGYVALWPTLAAVAIVVAGTTGSPLAADRLLNWAPLHYVGTISYALYLWHWPVLICYLAVTGRSVPSLVGGCYILALSVLLAAATTWITDNGLDRIVGARTTPMWSAVVGLACILPVVTAGAGWSTYLAERQSQREELAADPTKYPGAAAGVDGSESYPDLPVFPEPAEAADDLPVTYDNECNQDTTSAAVLTCEFGADDPERTIALVGGSHAAHWFPALMAIVEKNDWRLVNITKGACLFTDAQQSYKGRDYTECATWNDGVMTELEQLRPDAVFTTATSTSLDGETSAGGEIVVEGYAQRWGELDQLGIDVVAVRDTPRFGFDTASCLAENGIERETDTDTDADTDAGTDTAECGGTRTDSMADEAPYEGLDDVADNVSFIDLTDRLCDGDECPPVIGNVLVYWDGSHMTATFMRSMAPVLEPRLTDATGW